MYNSDAVYMPQGDNKCFDWHEVVDMMLTG